MRAGTPTLGTCAGLIMLDRDHLGLLDVSCRRNAFGRQVRSFEADLEVDGLGDVHAVFIRAPWVDDVGPGVEVLAEVEGHPVAVRQGTSTAVAFHPELSGDDRASPVAGRAGSRRATPRLSTQIAQLIPAASICWRERSTPCRVETPKAGHRQRQGEPEGGDRRGPSGGL